MSVIWTSEDKFDTLGHISELTIDGMTVTGPHHAITARDEEIFTKYKNPGIPKNGLVIAGEFMAKTTLDNVGHAAGATDALLGRMKTKKVKDRPNLIYMRIPATYDLNGHVIPVNAIDDLQASALVGVQLDADASVVVPPVPTGIQEIKAFYKVFERTTVEIQTFKEAKEIMGYIPKTDHLELVRDMVRLYIKNDIRMFGVDFAGASNCPALMRTLLRTIRESLKIKKLAGEDPDKNYYLHAFNVSSNKKSVNPVSPITDVLTHIYGVDSTSGVMWGGGKLEMDKLRYSIMGDYGAYRLNSLKANNISCPSDLTAGSTVSVMEKLKVDRTVKYAAECQNLSEKINAADTTDGYAPYVKNKRWAEQEAKKILLDVKEIKAV
jgi:hypothetical protein